MRFHYDLAHAEPVIKELLVYDGTSLDAGEAMEAAAVTDTNGAGGVNSADVDALIDMVGITLEAPANSVGVMATGTDYYAKCIINPLAVYLAEYDTTNAGTNTAADATGHDITDTGIDAYQVGGWTYVNGPSTDTGYGNLMKVGAQTGTTILTGVTGADYDDELKATTTASTYILIRRTFQGGVTGGCIDLYTGAAKIDGSIDSDGDAILLENFIKHKRFGMEPLRTARHSGKNVPGSTFYGDVYFTDHLLRGASTQA